MRARAQTLSWFLLPIISIKGTYSLCVQTKFPPRGSLRDGAVVEECDPTSLTVRLAQTKRALFGVGELEESGGVIRFAGW